MQKKKKKKEQKWDLIKGKKSKHWIQNFKKSDIQTAQTMLWNEIVTKNKNINVKRRNEFKFW